MIRSWPIGFLLGLALAGTGVPKAAAESPRGARDVDVYIEQALRDWSVPGASVAVVKDGRILLEKGYGVRELGRTEPVTANTLFGLGSITKTFTTATVARLVDAGKLSWDDRIADRLPGFQLSDPRVTGHVTIRDAVTHRVGLDEIDNNLPWILGTPTRKQYVASLRHVNLRAAFRDSFNYSNGMLDTVGELIEAVTGKRWEDEVAAQVFAPLGMSHTVSGRDQLVAKENLAPGWAARAPDKAVLGLAGLRPSQIDAATPHGPDRSGRMIVYPWHHEEMNAPAGGVTSSAHDMALFMLGHLSGKTPSGTPFLQRGTRDQIFSQQTALRAHATMDTENDTAGRVQDVGMALSWFVQTYAGHRILQHGGGQIGYSTLVLLVPAQNLGITVLLNEHYFDEHAFIARPLVTAIAYRLLDQQLGLPAVDWNKRFHSQWQEQKAAAGQAVEQYLKRCAADRQPPSLPLERYVGTYEHPANGRMQVRLKDGTLQFEFAPLVSGLLVHETGNLFRLEFDNEHYHLRALAVNFPADQKGAIESLTLKVALSGTDEFYPVDWTYRRTM